MLAIVSYWFTLLVWAALGWTVGSLFVEVRNLRKHHLEDHERIIELEEQVEDLASEIDVVAAHVDPDEANDDHYRNTLAIMGGMFSGLADRLITAAFEDEVDGLDDADDLDDEDIDDLSEEDEEDEPDDGPNED